jgi:PST family polysaccharide transporter
MYATYAIRAVILNLARFIFRQPSSVSPHFDRISCRAESAIATRMSEYAGRITENFLLDRIFGTALLGNYTLPIRFPSSRQIGGERRPSALCAGADGRKKPDRHPAPQALPTVGRDFVPPCFLVAAAAPELIDLLLGPKWVDLAFFLQVLLPLYSFSGGRLQSARSCSHMVA